MVFQNYALYPHKSVRENLAFGLRARRVVPARIKQRVDATAATLGLSALLDRKPGELSGGQRQRVALGRAIVREPQAFLLDEPLSNLDPMLRVATRTELALLHRRLAATMVYVTHDQEEAMTLGARVAVMRDGILEQVAPPLEVFRTPANAFVAGFVGSPAMNLWPCTCRHTDGTIRLTSSICSIELARGDIRCHDGTPLLMGIRPHDLELVQHGDGDATGLVAMVEPLGPTTVVQLRIASEPHALVRAVVPADRHVAVDDRVHIRVRRDRLHLFDQASGRRL